jgi:hypothetical protein
MFKCNALLISPRASVGQVEKLEEALKNRSHKNKKALKVEGRNINAKMAQAMSFLFSSSSDADKKVASVSSYAGDSVAPLNMTVLGLYKRAAIPREAELPEDYGIKHMSKDQVFCRERIKTKPLRVFHAGDDGENKQPEEEGFEVAISTSDKVLIKSLRVFPAANAQGDGENNQEKQEDFETAMFIADHGLVGSLFYHANLEEHEEDESDDDGEESDNQISGGKDPKIYEERTILIQAVEHYEKLSDHPALSKYLHLESGHTNQGPNDDQQETAKTNIVQKQQRRPEIAEIVDNPQFGEQILVQGCDSSQIAVGDVFEVKGRLSPLKIEVTSPRMCCAWVDKKFGSPFGLHGVKRYCTVYGLGGWFARVLVAGELRDGMKLIRTAHPHPKWTLTYISHALYGEGPKKHQLMGRAYWNRDIKELKELCGLKQLGRYEWKEEAEYILEHWEDYPPVDKDGKTLSANSRRKKKGVKSRSFFYKSVWPDTWAQLIFTRLLASMFCFELAASQPSEDH